MVPEVEALFVVLDIRLVHEGPRLYESERQRPLVTTDGKTGVHKKALRARGQARHVAALHVGPVLPERERRGVVRNYHLIVAGAALDGLTLMRRQDLAPVAAVVADEAIGCFEICFIWE